MCLSGVWLKAFRHLIQTAFQVLLDFLGLVALTCRSRNAVEAENLFLRKQLALFQERKNKPRRADDSTRWLMSFLSRWFDWRSTLVVVKLETLIRWHRRGFRLFWRWKSRAVGRPSLPKDIQALIRQMARENPSWGEEHIANELNLKLGIRVSPRTVGKYLAQGPRRISDPGQRWLTFVRQSCAGHPGRTSACSGVSASCPQVVPKLPDCKTLPSFGYLQGSRYKIGTRTLTHEIAGHAD